MLAPAAPCPARARKIGRLAPAAVGVLATVESGRFAADAVLFGVEAALFFRLKLSAPPLI